VREERKVVTVVFTDMVGSTARAEQLDPEDVRAFLAPYYERLRGELERFGGTVEKFIGDAVVAVFGAPIAHEDDPERAVRSALSIRAAIAEMNAADAWLDLHIRIGVNTGEALVVLDARPIEGQGMVAGDVINTAARLQSSAPVDGILVGEMTHRATAHSINYREGNPVQAKGKAKVLSVWEAVALKEAADRLPRARQPLIGRANEMEALHQIWNRAVSDRTPQLVTLVGVAGVGKSRLLAEFTSSISAKVYRGRCLSYGEGITYWPMVDVVRGAAQVLQSDEVEVISSKLGEFLDGLTLLDRDERRTISSALANLFGVPASHDGFPAGQITRAELHWGIRRLIQQLSAQSPLVLIVEDLHWAEPTLLDLVRYISEPISATPLLVVASTRPELVQERPGLFDTASNRHVMELDALSELDSRALIEELQKSQELSNASVDALIRVAGGNPLFLEETVEMFFEASRTQEGGARPSDSPVMRVPPNIQSLIGARLDQLTAEEKSIAQRASIAGPVFWEGAVAHLNGISDSLPRRLEGLVRRDLIHRLDASTVVGEREYAFKHILIRDVAYNQLPKGQRAKLHLRFAEWVSALPGSDEELVEIVAYHLEQSCVLGQQIARSPVPPPIDEAVDALVTAAQKAERREGLNEADRFYERALAIIGERDTPTVVAVRLGHAKIMTARGELRRSTAQLVDVCERALAVNRPDLRCEALIALANIDQKQGRAADARRRLVEAETIAAEIGDRCLQIRSGYESAELRADFDGQDKAAADDLRRSLEIATKLDDRALRIEGHLRIGMLLLNAGELIAAQEELLLCSVLAAEMGSRKDEARATYALGVAKYYLGDLREARLLGLQARDWLERTCDSYFQIQNLLALAVLALSENNPIEAERWLSEALPLALEGGGWLVVEIYRHMVEALVLQGRFHDAAELALFARKSVPEEDLNALAAVAIAEAHVATAEGNQTVALECFAEAIGYLSAQESHIQVAETRIAYARALRSFDKREVAKTELQRARATFERVHARALVAEIDRELATST
jgi:predicted ATPase/class 3 adenylate cyclase